MNLEYWVFFMGVMAALQMFILPGAIILKWSRLPMTTFKWLAMAAALSLTCNYIMVFLFTLLGWMQTDFMRLVVCAECLCIASLYREAFSSRLSSLRTGYHWKTFWHWCISPPHPVYKMLLLMLSGLIMAKFIFIFHHAMGGIFHVDDEVNSWNRWAMIWASGKIPSSDLYPQLVPTNYALLYTIMGRLPDAPFLVTFARSLMPLFSILCLLIVCDMLIKQKEERYLVALPLMGFVILGMLGKYIPRGYVDLPLAFFAFAALTFYLDIMHHHHRIKPFDLCLFAMICAGCGVVKQGGLYLPLVLPALAVYQWQHHGLLRASYRSYALVYGLALFIALPWYLYTEHFFAHGFSAFNTYNLTVNMWQAKGTSVAMAKLSNLFKRSWFVMILFILSLMDIRKHQAWRSVIFFTIPYAVIWAFTSPDPRNIAFAIPMLVCSASGPLADFAFAAKGGVISLQKIRVAHVITLGFLMLMAFSATKNLRYQALQDRQSQMVQSYTGEASPSEGVFHFFPS